jgi:hypothetical protein
MARPRKNPERALALVVKDLLENDSNISDIGAIIGALGEDSTKWLSDLKKECSSVEEFIELAKKRADITLIAAAVKTALGFKYDEIKQKFIKVVVGQTSTGEPVIVEKEGGKEVKTKHALPNDALLRFILKCRLPEYFQDVQKVEINKKSIEIKEITANEIKEFGRKLLESFDKKTDGN